MFILVTGVETRTSFPPRVLDVCDKTRAVTPTILVIPITETTIAGYAALVKLQYSRRGTHEHEYGMSFKSFLVLLCTTVYQVTDDDSTLIVVSSESQQLYTVDPDTGEANVIDLGGDVLGPRGDGLVRG